MGGKIEGLNPDKSYLIPSLSPELLGPSESPDLKSPSSVLDNESPITGGGGGSILIKCLRKSCES